MELEVLSAELSRDSVSLSRTPPSSATEVSSAHKLYLHSPNLLELQGGTYVFHSPSRTLDTLVRKGHTLWSGDFYSNIGVFGWSDGTLQVYGGLDSNTPMLMRDLKGHLMDVSTCRFFPSGKVVLSGGSDFALRIWDLQTGNCAALLKGHKKGVLSCDFVDRGRNVVSSGRDGCRLWSVPTQQTIHAWAPRSELASHATVANATEEEVFAQCRVLRQRDPSSESQRQLQSASSEEFGTDGNLLLLASSLGCVRAIDLRAKNEICSLNSFKLKPKRDEMELENELDNSALNAVHATGHFVVAGGDAGIYRAWDLRKSDATLNAGDASSKILSICSSNADSTEFYFGLSDGSVLSWDFQVTRNASATLVGTSNEPIHALARVTQARTHDNDGDEGNTTMPRLLTANRKGLVNVFDLK